MATIILLAITVTLFGVVFAFVTRFPAPPVQSVNQFVAGLVYTNVTSSGSFAGTYCGTTKISTSTTGGGQICELEILQAGGPTVPSTDAVYLSSTSGTTEWQFSRSSGVPVAWGIGNSTSGWSTGQTWTTTFSKTISVPANLTVLIGSPYGLLYEGLVPGASPNSPPVLTSAYTNVTPVIVGAPFQIDAIVSGNTSGLTVTVSLSEIPGVSALGTVTMTHASSTSSLYYYNVTSANAPSTAGSYLAFFSGSSTTGATVSGSVVVTVASSSSSGSPSGLSASVSINPNPPTVRTNATLVATISNAGASSATVSSVTFYVNTTSHTLLAKLSGTSSPTVAPGTTRSVSTAAWMAGPNATGVVNLTVVVKFTSGVLVTGASSATFGAAPFTASVSELPQNATTQTTGGTWYVLVAVENYGSLGSSTVSNITVYVNQSGSKVGIVTPPPTKSKSNPGYPAAGTTLAANSTSTFVADWIGPGTSAASITIQVVVKVTNALWSSFSPTTLTLTPKTTPGLSITFTD